MTLQNFSREPVIEHNSSPPHGRTWAVSDARVAAALNFVGLFYQGSGVSLADAMKSAREALALFESRR